MLRAHQDEREAEGSRLSSRVRREARGWGWHTGERERVRRDLDRVTSPRRGASKRPQYDVTVMHRRSGDRPDALSLRCRGDKSFSLPRGHARFPDVVSSRSRHGWAVAWCQVWNGTRCQPARGSMLSASRSATEMPVLCAFIRGVLLVIRAKRSVFGYAKFALPWVYLTYRRWTD